MLIERLIFCDSDETEITLPFYRSLLTLWNIFRALYTQHFHSCAWVRGDVN